MSDEEPTDIQLARQWRDENSSAIERHRSMPSEVAYVWELLDATLRYADTLEAIVRDLAAEYGPNGPGAPDGYVGLLCALCKASLDVRQPQHDDDCPWRRAVEWVRLAAQRAILDEVGDRRLATGGPGLPRPSSADLEALGDALNQVSAQHPVADRTASEGGE